MLAKRFIQYPFLYISIAIIIAFFSFISIVYLVDKQKDHTLHYIQLTEEGFLPSFIIIAKGDRIVFSTTRSEMFWPASDLHPTHAIYPAFDPQQPIDPKKSWSFTFDKSGTWKYHDHITSVYRGTITVIGEDVSSIGSSQSGCSENCTQRDMKEALQQYNIKGAFDIIKRLYNNDSDFASLCHTHLHQVGQTTYHLFKTHSVFRLPVETSYCGYAFYHGFMEALLHTTSNIQEASQFCDQINQYIELPTSKASIACYHGIGHGITEDGIEERSGSAQLAINPMLRICEKVGKTEFDKEICSTGVFNSLTIAINSHRSHIDVDTKDPYWLCRKQEYSYLKKGCFQEFATYAQTLAKGNFREAAQFVEGIDDIAFALPAIDNLAASFALPKAKYSDHDDLIDVCHDLQSRLQQACINGIAGSLLENGNPGKEYITGFNFCKSKKLKKNEQNECMSALLSLAHVFYPQEKYRMVCAEADEAYRIYCRI